MALSGTFQAFSGHKVGSGTRQHACLVASRTSAYAGRSLGAVNVSRTRSRDRRGSVGVVAFKFLKELGLKKPSFLPDFGKDKRKAILDRFYGPIDRNTYEDLLAPDFTMSEEGGSKTYTRADYINLMCDSVAPAIPDFNWTHATDAVTDKDGFAIVTVQATGHHTGKPFEMRGTSLPPVPAEGKRFLLNEEIIRVKVEDGKIKQIIVVPSQGAGPRALYVALGGKLPVAAE